MPRYPSFVGASYTSQSKLAAVERCVNWYPERIETPGGKTSAVLYPCPGYALWGSMGTGAARGFLTNNGRSFSVIGTELYELAVSGVGTLRGSGLNDLDGSPATLATNGDAGNQIMIASGSKGYLYNLNTHAFSQVIDNANKIGFVDGFFLALDTLRSELKISALEDGSSWDAGDVTQRNDAPDRWSSMLVVNKEIWMFGADTASVYYNSGAAFPFVPNPNVFIQAGILAPDSAAVLDSSAVWLGRSKDGGAVVFRAQGYQPIRISTHALEYALSRYATLTDAHAWTYQEQGHSFYVLTFPTAGATWVYDASTGLWHERGSWVNGAYTAVPVYGHTYAFGQHLVGGRTGGAIYRQSIDLTTDPAASTGAWSTIRRMRRAPALYFEGRRLVFDAMELELEVGLGSQGVAGAPGVNPQIMLRWSDDGGQTWSSEHWVSAGLIGQYRARAMWRRLGQARDRVFEVVVSDPIPWRVVDAYLKTSAERE